MKNNKRITWFLIALLLAVWGTIAYQIVNAVSSDDSNEIALARPKDLQKGELLKFAYQEDVRDPFQYVEQSKVPRKEKQFPNEPFLLAPPYRLTGIVTNETGKTAILESPDGSVFFVREKESVGGVKVLRIQDQRVAYSYMNRKAEWLLAEAR